MLWFDLVYTNVGWSCVGLHVGREQVVCVQRNIKARLRNNCSLRKAISITYSRWVFVALGIQHGKRIIAVCVLCDSTIYFYILS